MGRIKVLLAVLTAAATMVVLAAPAMAQSSLEFSPSSGDLDISGGDCIGVIRGGDFNVFRVSSGDVDNDFCDNDNRIIGGVGGLLIGDSRDFDLGSSDVGEGFSIGRLSSGSAGGGITIG